MKQLTISAFIALVLLIVFTGTGHSQESPTLAASPTPSTTKEREEVAALVESYYQRHQKWAVVTFIAYAGAFLLSALANTFAAIVLKSDRIKDTRWNTAAFWFALSGAAAVTLNGTYGFGERWTSNRQSQAAVEELRIDLTNPLISAANIRIRLKGIEAAHAKAKVASKINGEALGEQRQELLCSLGI